VSSACAAAVADAGTDRVLKLDRAAGGHHRRGEQRRDMADSSGKQTARCGGSGRARSAHAGSGRCGSASRSATEAEQLRQHAERSERWRQRSELTARPAQLRPERPTACAIVHMPARAAARPDASIVREHKRLVDLDACGVARLRSLGEADPCADKQRLDRGDRDPDRRRHVRVRHPAKLAHQQSRALLIGEAADILDQPAQRLPLLGLDRWVVDRSAEEAQHLGRRRHRAPQLVDAAVVGDPVEPCAQGQLAVVCPQADVRTDEDVLQRILGIGPRARKHLARVREQALLVAVVDRAERLLVAGAE
jgi:hypothetical protein